MKKINEILLLDDFRFEYNIHKTIISQYFEVTTFSCFLNVKNTKQYLLEKLNQQKPFPEYLFVDLNLPLNNGWEFIHWYGKLANDTTKNSTLVVLSGSALREVPEKIDPSIIKHTIEKPLSLEKLKGI